MAEGGVMRYAKPRLTEQSPSVQGHFTQAVEGLTSRSCWIWKLQDVCMEYIDILNFTGASCQIVLTSNVMVSRLDISIWK